MARSRIHSPSQPDDARTRRSIEALSAALLELLEQQPLEQIAIKDITTRAGISYPTFFRRFASKENLLDHIAAAEVDRLLSPSDGDGRDSGAPRMCAYVQSRRQLWQALLTGGAAPAMRQAFMRAAHAIARAGPRINPWIPEELAVSFVTSGIFEIFSWWLRQPDDYPVANVITLFDALIVDVTGRKRNIALV